MRRPATELPFTCATCEAEIRARPVVHVGLPFCCAGCVADGPCTCSYDLEELRHDPAADRTITATVALPAHALDDERRLAGTRG